MSPSSYITRELRFEEFDNWATMVLVHPTQPFYLSSLHHDLPSSQGVTENNKGDTM